MAGLRLDGVALLQHGPTIGLALAPGESLCVVGPAAAGKSKLLRILAGMEPPDRGSVERDGTVLRPERIANRALKPQDLGRRRGDNQASLATEVLSAMHLWDFRQTSIGEMAPAQAAACELVEPLMGGNGIYVLDSVLDRLDPWCRESVWALLRERMRSGAVVIVATDQLDLASRFDSLVVMKDHAVTYSGRIGELLATRGDRSVTIETERQMGVRALVDPLLVGVTRTGSGYKLEPGPGQEHTARLLREGYGDVKFTVVDQRSLPEIILGLL